MKTSKMKDGRRKKKRGPIKGDVKKALFKRAAELKALTDARPSNKI